MNLETLLQYLDASQDEAERRIGIDWLQENGYIKEASFYRWLLANELEPAKGFSEYLWFRPFSDELTGVRPMGAVKATTIPHEQIWASLPYSGSRRDRYYCYFCRGYKTRSAAICQLRLAYLQELYS